MLQWRFFWLFYSNYIPIHSNDKAILMPMHFIPPLVQLGTLIISSMLKNPFKCSKRWIKFS